MICRKNEIDLNIHHVSAFLYAMTKSGLQPIEALESLVEHKNVYGVIADEFEIAVRRVKYFGESLNSALKYVASTTSSKKLREFIFGFILATQQSLSVESYFKIKFDEFFERERRDRAAMVQLLSLVGEFVVVLVALTPVLVLTIGLSLGILNPEVLQWSNMYILLILPISSILALLYVKAIIPSEKLASVSKIAYPVPVIENVPIETKNQDKKSISLEKKEKWIIFKSALRKPVNLFLMYPNFIILLYSLVLLLLIVYFYFAEVVPNVLAVYTLLGSCLTLVILHEVRIRYVRSLERRIPDFLRGMAETVEREGSIIRTIDLVLKSRFGLLGKEFGRFKATKLGVPLKRALLMIEYRTASPILKRVLVLLVKAFESTTNIKDVLMMAADDVEAYIRLRREKSLSLIGYVVSTYVCFGVYVYVYWILKNQFISSLSGFSGFAQTALIGAIMTQGYYVALFLGLVLGLMVGAMVEGSILSGLKHSLIMIIIAIALLGWSP